MSNDLQINTNIDELIRSFGDLRDNTRSDHIIKSIAYRSINRALTSTRQVISQEIRATYYVTADDIKQRLRIKIADRKNIKGELDYRFKRALPLSMFGAVQNQNFVSVRVLRDNRRRRIQAGGPKNILVSETRRGRSRRVTRRARVWMANDRRGQSQIYALTERFPHVPIALYGPSFMSYFYKDENKQRIQTVLSTNLKRNIEDNLRAYAQGFFTRRRNNNTDTNNISG